MKIFFVTDLHGSEICWKKFLNAGAFYKADVVILGGDVTGKAMVPIVQRANGSWEASLQDHLESFETNEEIAEFEKRVMNRGYYPIRVSQEEYVAMQEDEDLVDKRFKEAMLDGTERWIAMAEDKLAGSGIRVSITDNGRGFDPADVPGDRFGLRTMRERAEMIGARLTIDSQASGGTAVVVEIPGTGAVA